MEKVLVMYSYRVLHLLAAKLNSRLLLIDAKCPTVKKEWEGQQKSRGRRFSSRLHRGSLRWRRQGDSASAEVVSVVIQEHRGNLL